MANPAYYSAYFENIPAKDNSRREIKRKMNTIERLRDALEAETIVETEPIEHCRSRGWSMKVTDYLKLDHVQGYE